MVAAQEPPARLPTKQRLGLVVRRLRGGRDDLRVGPLLATMDEWEPTSFQRDLLEEDAELLEKVTADTVVVPDGFRLAPTGASLDHGGARDLG